MYIYKNIFLGQDPGRGGPGPRRTRAGTRSRPGYPFLVDPGPGGTRAG